MQQPLRQAHLRIFETPDTSYNTAILPKLLSLVFKGAKAICFYDNSRWSAVRNTGEGVWTAPRASGEAYGQNMPADTTARLSENPSSLLSSNCPPVLASPTLRARQTQATLGVCVCVFVVLGGNCDSKPRADPVFPGLLIQTQS